MQFFAIEILWKICETWWNLWMKSKDLKPISRFQNSYTFLWNNHCMEGNFRRWKNCWIWWTAIYLPPKFFNQNALNYWHAWIMILNSVINVGVYFTKIVFCSTSAKVCMHQNFPLYYSHPPPAVTVSQYTLVIVEWSLPHMSFILYCLGLLTIWLNVDCLNPRSQQLLMSVSVVAVLGRACTMYIYNCCPVLYL